MLLHFQSAWKPSTIDLNDDLFFFCFEQLKNFPRQLPCQSFIYIPLEHSPKTDIFYWFSIEFEAKASMHMHMWQTLYILTFFPSSCFIFIHVINSLATLLQQVIDIWWKSWQRIIIIIIYLKKNYTDISRHSWCELNVLVWWCKILQIQKKNLLIGNNYRWDEMSHSHYCSKWYGMGNLCHSHPIFCNKY